MLGKKQPHGFDLFLSSARGGYASLYLGWFSGWMKHSAVRELSFGSDSTRCPLWERTVLQYPVEIANIDMAYWIMYCSVLSNEPNHGMFETSLMNISSVTTWGIYFFGIFRLIWVSLGLWVRATVAAVQRMCFNQSTNKAGAPKVWVWDELEMNLLSRDGWQRKIYGSQGGNCCRFLGGSLLEELINKGRTTSFYAQLCWMEA